MSATYSYCPHTSEDIKKMLSYQGLESVDELFLDIPEEVKLRFDDWDFPQGLGEAKTLRYLNAIASRNKKLTTFIGLGVYDHEIPSAVWALANKAEFVTAYTPYQAEASQGMLQAIFEFQSMISVITGMDVANASVYDGATALCEAMLMACQEKRKNRIAVSLGVNPFYREVIQTYALAIGIDIVWLPLNNGQTDFSILQGLETGTDVSAYIMQQPNYLGILEDTSAFENAKKLSNALGIVSINPILSTVLRKPAEYGADIVCGEGQSLGIPLNSGGPLLGFMATSKKLTRKLPGRIVGMTTDKYGKDAFVLTLQAREQHIRREKASSNICTNQALNALAATIYISLMGPKGLKEVAESSIQNTHYLAGKLREIGVKVWDDKRFLMEFPVYIEKERAERLRDVLLERGFTPPIPLFELEPNEGLKRDLEDVYLLCATEKRFKEEIDEFVAVWEEIFR